MARGPSRLKWARSRRALVAAVVVAAGLTAAVVGYLGTRGEDVAALEEGQQLVEVRLGDLVNQVTSSGSIVFPNREELSFGVAGTVGALLVAEGDQVAAGQPLARIDDETAAGVERDAAQAQVDLQDSQEAMDDAMAPPTALARVEAEAAVADAELSLQQAQEALDDAMAPPTTLTRAEAEAAVAMAELSLQQAQEALSDVKIPFTQAEIDEARGDVALAADSVTRAEADLAFDLRQHGETVDEAVETLETAREDYQGVVRAFLGMTLTSNDYAMTPADLLIHYDIDVDSFFSDSRRAEAVAWVNPFDPLTAGPVDDPATPWHEFTVYSWIALYPGAVYGTCENVATDPRDRCMLQEMESAWEKVDAAQDDLYTAEYNQAKARSDGNKAVDKEEDALTVAQEALDDMLAAVDTLEVRVKEHDVEVARAKLEDARDALADLDVAPDTVEVRVKEHDVEVARAELADARDALADLDAAPDALSLALMQAEIAADEAALAAAQERLASLVIAAPFAGVVSAVNVEVGRSVNANAAILEVVDPTVAEVDARLDEIDVLTVQEGAQAMVSLDGLPGAQLPGVVTSISRTGDNQQGVVTYPVQISVQTPPFLQLREGLTATASIVLQLEMGALLIPSTAIAGTFQQPTVLVSLDGEVTERPVTLGASDGFWIVATSGVEEGEQLVSTGGGDALNFGNIPILGGFGGPGGGPQGLSPEQRQALRQQFQGQGGGGQGPQQQPPSR